MTLLYLVGYVGMKVASKKDGQWILVDKHIEHMLFVEATIGILCMVH